MPVISVGNVVVGGTGKTPLIDFLAQEIEGCAILSRGYRSESVRKNLLVSKEMDARVCGDEPLLLSGRGYSVYVGRNRFLSAKMAENRGARALLLDDGMQQRWLKSDVQIAVVGGKNLFGNGFFLPRGELRDSPKRLKKVDLVVVNGADDFAAVADKVKQWTDAPVVGMQPKVVGVFSAEEKISIAGKKVRIFCAIANPERFVESVKKLGAEVVDVVIKPDHAHFAAKELKATDVDWLICTEKDWVKLKCPGKKIAYVKIALTVVENETILREFLSQVRQLVTCTNGGTK